MELTQQIVRELIDYDPATGFCRWKERDVKWFKGSRRKAQAICNKWNMTFSGKVAGSIMNNRRYCITLLSHSILLHRIIWLYMTGEWPNVIDHIDGDAFNNRWENLRNVDIKTNMKNMKISKRNTSGVLGVSFHKKLSKWRSDIRVDGKLIYLGLFPCIAHAVRARKEAEIKYGFHPNHGRK